MNHLTNSYSVLFFFIPPSKQKNFDKRLQSMIMEDGPKTVIEVRGVKYNVPIKGLIKESNKIIVEDNNGNAVLKFIKRSDKVSKLKQLALSLPNPDLRVDLDELLQMTPSVMSLKQIFKPISYVLTEDDIKQELKEDLDCETSVIKQLNNNTDIVFNRLLYTLAHILPVELLNLHETDKLKEAYNTIVNYKPSDNYIQNKDSLSIQSQQDEVSKWQNIIYDISQQLTQILPDNIIVKTPMNMFIVLDNKDDILPLSGILLTVTTIIDALTNSNNLKDILVYSMLSQDVSLSKFTTFEDKAKLTVGQILKTAIPLSIISDQNIKNLFNNITQEQLDSIYYLSKLSTISKQKYVEYFKVEKPDIQNTKQQTKSE